MKNRPKAGGRTRAARAAPSPRPASRPAAPRARSAAQRLRESEERFDFAMQAINEGVYDWDIAKGTIYYSKRVRNALGISPEEVRTPAAFLERLHPEDRPRFRAATVAHFKGETERFECDYRFRARDGTWRWARQHGVALRDARGRAYRMIGSTGDITELKEREQQLAEQTAGQRAVGELLEAISRSAFDLDGVLRTLVESATRLCRAEKGFIFRLDGDVYRLAVDYGGVSPEFRDFVAQLAMRAGRETVVGRTALEKRTVHIEDILADGEFELPESQRIGGFRTILGVPILRDDVVIGVIALWKERVEPFTPAQIQLVTTFSSQASIAIENARLFGETKEALDHQKASAEVLHVISSSVADTRPVFEKILESCERLFEGRHVQICLVGEDGGVHLRAYHGPSRAEFERHFPVPLSRESGSGVAILERRVVHYPDVLGAGVPEYMRRGAMIAGNKSVIVAPMLWEDRGIGAVVVGRDTVGEFSEREIALLKTFADQAVIAIENVRLFNETKEALERQTATAEILRVISTSPTDIQPVLDSITESAARLCNAQDAHILQVKGDTLYVTASHAEFRIMSPGESAPIRWGLVVRSRGPCERGRACPRHRVGRGSSRIPGERLLSAAIRAPDDARVAAAARGGLDRHHPGSPARGPPVHREADRAAQDFRRPGGDRDRERAALQRDQGSTGRSRRPRPRSSR